MAKETLTEFRLNALVGAVNRQTDFQVKAAKQLNETLEDRLMDIADVLDDPANGGDVDELFALLQNLDKRLERIETGMATQEERLQAIGAALVNVQAGVDRIQASLEELKANNPALEDEIGAIEAQVAALGADVAEATPEPEPEPEPTPEGEGSGSEG